MPIAMTDEQRDLQESIRSWAAKFETSTTIRNREPDPERDQDARDAPTLGWAELAEIGVFAIAVPEESGGAGAGIADLAAALEETAYALVPGAVLPTCLAGALLGRETDSPVAADVLPGLAGGRISVAVAWDSAQLEAVEAADGSLTVSGEVNPVLGDAESSYLLLSARTSDSGEAWFIVDTERAGVRLENRPATDFSRSLSRVVLHDVTIPSDARMRGPAGDDVADLAVTLFAAEASGVAAWCLRTAVEHARTREQFGNVIGSFQAVKHLCSQMLCRVEQAGALAWDAARTRDELPAEHALAAAAAGAVALDAAVDTVKDCIQVLGGVGFTWEHDAHLYLRRALALRQLAGGSSRWRHRAASLALDGARRNLNGARELPGEVERQRESVRGTARELAALPAEQQRIGLADSGYLAPHWPEPYGHSATPAMQLLIDEELHRAGISRPDLIIGGWAAPTILEHGTREQQERFVRPTLRGELVWCQLFSEPGAGSDLAALRTRAERVPGGWRLSGQKVWTSQAHQADWAICLARTDFDEPKHRGITYFLVDMDDPAIEVRPLREITGVERFNEVFLDGVFVSDGHVVGEPGAGWRLARTTLANERVAMAGGSALGHEVERLIELARERKAADDHGIRERIGAQVAQGLSVSLLGSRAMLRRLNGQDPGAESSVEKLVGVDHRQAVAELSLELLGADGAALDGDSAAVTGEFLLSRCLSIAGGTTQILRTVAAERILGLPRK